MTVPASGDDPARTPVVPQTEPSGPQLWLNVVDVFHIFSRGTVRGQVPRGMTVEFVPKASTRIGARFGRGDGKMLRQRDRLRR